MLKSILSAARDMEEEIYGLFEALPGELAGRPLPDSLRRIIAEEAEHRRLLEQMIAGRLSDEEIRLLLEARELHLHDPQALPPLAAGPRAELAEPLRRILAQEEKICRFFGSLWHRSNLPFVKKAFRFLAEQEQTHVTMLRRLLGEAE
jgi:rubrerythrin